ncbi:hypothetical protein [Methylobacterium oryzae]|nr:hypothetical protein [Methylobacterium oryzae]
MTLRWKAPLIVVMAISAYTDSASQAHEPKKIRYSKYFPDHCCDNRDYLSASGSSLSNEKSNPEITILKLFESESINRKNIHNRTDYFSKQLKRIWRASEKHLEEQGIYEGVWGQTVFTNGARPMQITKILSMKTTYGDNLLSRAAIVDFTARFENPELLHHKISTHKSQILLIKEGDFWKINNIKYIDQKPFINPKTGKRVPTDLIGLLV